MTINKHSVTLFPMWLVMYEMMVYLTNDMYLPALPGMLQQFHLNQAGAQAILTSWFLGAASLQLVLGPLADKFGRRPVLLWGGIIFVISTLICVLTHDYHWLLIARFLQGSSSCSMLVAGYATIHELFDNQRAIKTLAWMGSIVVLAPACGPLVGAIALHVISWRGIFLMLALGGLISLVGLYFHMPETLKPQQTRLTVFTNYKKVFCDRGFMVNTLASSFLFAGLITWLAEGPFLTMHYWHKTAVAFGFYQLFILTSFIVGNEVTRELLQLMGTKLLTQVALLSAALGGLLGVVLSWWFPYTIFGLLTCMILFALGSGIGFSLLQRMAIASCEVIPMGIRMAVFSTITSAGAVLGSMLALLCKDGNPLNFCALVAIVGLIAGGIKIFVPHQQHIFVD